MSRAGAALLPPIGAELDDRMGDLIAGDLDGAYGWAHEVVAARRAARAPRELAWGFAGDPGRGDFVSPASPVAVMTAMPRCRHRFSERPVGRHCLPAGIRRLAWFQRAAGTSPDSRRGLYGIAFAGWPSPWSLDMRHDPIDPGASSADERALAASDERVRRFRRRLDALEQGALAAIAAGARELETLRTREAGGPDDDAARRHAIAVLIDVEARERQELEAIAAARARLLTGTFGICTACGQSIPLSRLEAVPTARLCPACRTKLEQQATPLREAG